MKDIIIYYGSTQIVEYPEFELQNITKISILDSIAP